jgi:tetratricopeptide (TPR) repeat protein
LEDLVDERSLTLQDLIRRRQVGGFVGRRAQLGLFEESLGLPVDDPRRRFLFSLHGNAGVGKTYLVRQLIRLARERGYLTTYVDEALYDVLGTMEAIVGNLEQQGVRCKEFRTRLAEYRQYRSELDGDPLAPEGMSSLLTRSAVRIGLRAAGDLPLIGAVVEELDSDAVVGQIDRLRTFLNQKFRNQNEVQLLLSPVDSLTPVFLTELIAAARRHPIALFFDTYEQTCTYLEVWLLNLLAGRHGSLPGNLALTISGQLPLDVNRWGDYLGIRADMPLGVFSEAEARELLLKRGVSADGVVDVILRLSGRLPLLVAMLAEAPPEDIDTVDDPSRNAVERFLKWEKDTRRRTAAMHGALPRRLDREAFTVATGSPSPDDDFAWLRQLPFVGEHADGFRYHDFVRIAMLRVIRRIAPREWEQRHIALADHYCSNRDALQLSERDARKDDRWQNLALEEHYHRLCAQSSNALVRARAGLVDIIAWQRSSVPRWIQMIQQAGADADVAGILEYGDRLWTWSGGDDESQLLLLSDLADDYALDDQHRGVAYIERGKTYRLMGRYDEALIDFNRAIELDSRHKWAITHRGYTNELMGRYDKALADFSRAIQLDPQYKWAIVRRSYTYRLMDRYDEALADFDRAIELDPRYKWAIAHRGYTYRLMGRYDEALIDFNRAIELDSRYEWAIVRRGETYRLMNRYNEALTDFRRATGLAESGWTYYQIALTSLAKGEPRDAPAQLHRALDFERQLMSTMPDKGRRAFNVAVYLLALGRRHEAKQQVHKSLESSPGPMEIWDAIRDFEDLQIATTVEISEFVSLLRSSLPS